MTECPQCGTMNDDDVKNCKNCRINLYRTYPCLRFMPRDTICKNGGSRNGPTRGIAARNNITAGNNTA